MLMVVLTLDMLSPRENSYDIYELGSPPHLEELTYTGLELLRLAYSGDLDGHGLPMRTEASNGFDRVYFDTDPGAITGEYNRVAVHLGRDALLVALDRRHVEWSGDHGQPGVSVRQQSTVVISGARAQLFTLDTPKGGAPHDITEDRFTARVLTGRLQGTLGAVGVNGAIESMGLKLAG